MMTLDVWIQFLGWMALVNGTILIVATILLNLMREWIMNIHSALMGMDRADLPALYFSYLANFKIAWIFLNLVPYLVLRLAI